MLVWVASVPPAFQLPHGNHWVHCSAYECKGRTGNDDVTEKFIYGTFDGSCKFFRTFFKVLTTICDSIKQIFREDKSGDVTLEVNH